MLERSENHIWGKRDMSRRLTGGDGENPPIKDIAMRL